MDMGWFNLFINYQILGSFFLLTLLLLNILNIIIIIIINIIIIKYI